MTAGNAEARARLERLFEGFNRLTPDELARIGYRSAHGDEHDELMDAVDDAANRTGRRELVDEARWRAGEAVMRRYAEGTLHPTWVALNWGLSQGTVEDRVAIVEALADAAAAVVVEDVLDPEVAAALGQDAEQVLGLAGGSASDGSLARALHQPDDPDLGPSRAGHAARLAIAVVAVAVTTFGFGVVLGPAFALAAGLVSATLVAALNLPRRRSSGTVR